MKADNHHVTFVVGEDRSLSEIISRAEIEPLLRSLVKAGPEWAVILDEQGLQLCRYGSDSPLEQFHEIRHPLLVEGEPQGTLVIAFDPAACRAAAELALLARDALQLTVTNNLKRMLTTEMHTTVVQESYDQLVETNKRLAESEKRYRELALSLEQKVEQRTTELRKAYARMLQQEKLAAVGGLAAGMAHEINNPNGFVRSNLATFMRYFERMRDMLDFYRMHIAANTPLYQLQLDAEQKRSKLKLDFVMSDACELLKQSMEGSDRISRIVADFKSFSHVDECAVSDADLNIELERTISVLGSHFLPGTVVHKDLQPLPLFGCNPGVLSQAFLNIIQNAIQSRADGLEIHVTSRSTDDEIVIGIADNGSGISAADMPRIFEPFFTTQEVGSGTGMGLTVAREIVNGAGGSIDIESLEGSGTTVAVRLPRSR